MAFKIWQTGVHIQQDRALIVALAREKLGWCLRRWWAIPLDEGIIRDGKICQPEQLVDALRDWRKTLPHYHRVFLSFPAARTLQRTLPRPTVALRDSEQLSWLGAALARELEMSADTLCFDYAQDTFSNTFHVTAAQNNEIDTLLALAKTLRLRLVAITPDAARWRIFFPRWHQRRASPGGTIGSGCGRCATSGDAALPQKPKTCLSCRRCWRLVRMTSRCLIADVIRGKSWNAAMPRYRTAALIIPLRWRWP